MNDATDIIDSILATLPDREGLPSAKAAEYTGNLIAINSGTAKDVISTFLDGLPVKIGVGERWKTMRSYAGLLWACGYPADDIRKKLTEFDKKRNNPPKGNTEDIDKIIAFIVTRPQGFRERKTEGVQDAPVPKTPINTKAIEILKTGNPLEFLLEGFRLNHAGHEENARAIIYAFCAQSSGTSKGIQPEVTGSKGSGKSHSISSTLFLMPQEYIWESSFSPKFLFYKPPLQGCIIYIDERLSDELVNLVKKIMSNFQRETRHSTLVERKPVDLVIPKRLVIMGSTVNGAGDDQYNDRTVQVGILNTKEDDEKYYEFETNRRKEGRPEFQITEHIETCRAMLKHIREQEFVVTIPRIKFAYLHDKRLINILFDFVEASAILNYLQREHTQKETETGPVITVTPNAADLQAALNFEMFRMSNRDVEGRLSKAETALHQRLQGSTRDPESQFTESEIADIYGKSQNAVRKLLYGDGGTQNMISGGLVDKTPGWYTITPSTNPDLKGVHVIRCKKVQSGFGGSYATYDE